MMLPSNNAGIIMDNNNQPTTNNQQPTTNNQQQMPLTQTNKRAHIPIHNNGANPPNNTAITSNN
jgi:hypothetical protein